MSSGRLATTVLKKKRRVTALLPRNTRETKNFWRKRNETKRKPWNAYDLPSSITSHLALAQHFIFITKLPKSGCTVSEWEERREPEVQPEVIDIYEDVCRERSRENTSECEQSMHASTRFHAKNAFDDWMEFSKCLKWESVFMYVKNAACHWSFSDKFDI